MGTRGNESVVGSSGGGGGNGIDRGSSDRKTEASGVASFLRVMGWLLDSFTELSFTFSDFLF